jgi:Spy/CpxP family protein refolding chaperone
MQAEKFKDLKAQHDEMVKKARDRIMTLFGTEQSDKVEKFLAQRRGGGGAPGGGPPGRGGPPQAEPATKGYGAGARATDGRPPAVLAVQQATARFQLAQDGGGPPGGILSQLTDEERERLRTLIQRGMLLRQLDDPEVRADLGFTPEQEKKFQDLKQQAMSLVGRIQEDIRAKFDGQSQADMTDDEKQALRRDMMQAGFDAFREAMGNFEQMMNEAGDALTPEQRDKLATLSRDRATTEIATGGLSILLTQQAREACGFTSDQVDRIRAILKGLEADAKELRDRIFGPGKELTKEDMQSEKFKDLKARHDEMVKKARDRIMTLFGTEQREKVEKFLAQRRGPGRPGAGQPGRSGPPQPEPPAKGPQQPA